MQARLIKLRYNTFEDFAWVKDFQVKINNDGTNVITWTELSEEELAYVHKETQNIQNKYPTLVFANLGVIKVISCVQRIEI